MLQSENDRLKDAMRSTAPRALSSKVPCLPHYVNLHLAPYLVPCLSALSSPLSAPTPPVYRYTEKPSPAAALRTRGMDADPNPTPPCGPSLCPIRS